jgi:hypothetical protein
MILNRPVKDLDIFLSMYNHEQAEEKFKDLAFKDKISYIKKSRDTASNNYPDNFTVYDLLSLNNERLSKPVQIIFHDKSIYDLIKGFDYDFCKVYMRGNGKVRSFDAFDCAIKTKVCEYKSKPNLGEGRVPAGTRDRALSKIVQRHKGFKEKFPDFKFIGID